MPSAVMRSRWGVWTSELPLKPTSPKPRSSAMRKMIFGFDELTTGGLVSPAASRDRENERRRDREIIFIRGIVNVFFHSGRLIERVFAVGSGFDGFSHARNILNKTVSFMSILLLKHPPL